MKLNPKLVVLLGALGVSISPILIKWSNAPALTIAFYRMLFTVLILTPYIISKKRQEIKQISSSNIKKTCVSGFFLGLHFSTWILSLKYTTVASATILVNTSPILLLLISYFIFKEQIKKQHILAILMAFSGSMLLAYGDFSGGSNAILGDLFALSGAAFVSVYLLIGNQVRQSLTMVTYTYLTYLTAGLTIFLLNLFVKHSLVIVDPKEVILFLGMAIFPTLLGHSLFNWSLKYVSATYVSMAILLEPILASIFAVFLLSEVPTLGQVIGSFIIIASIGYYTFSKK